MRFDMKALLIVSLMAATSYCTGCNPWGLPGLKQQAKKEEQRITRETEEAIKKSPGLQELNRLCTEEIPRPEGFVSVNKSRDFNEEQFLSYGYHSTHDYQSVKRFYLDYFVQHGWQLKTEKDSGWGPSKLEFRKDSYGVVIYDMGAGEGENYGIVCKKF